MASLGTTTAELGDSVFVGMQDESNFFSGKTIVITGAGGQFGREGCAYFAKRGARIAALDVDKKGLEETFSALRDVFGSQFDCKLFLCDVTNAAQVKDVVGTIVSRFKRIDLLWNNAGYQGMIKPTLAYDPEDFARVMNINVTGVSLLLEGSNAGFRASAN
jgi:NAD(P)-dependent dehydrogenase (short-subunit alcohol dehydrogenase family)